MKLLQNSNLQYDNSEVNYKERASIVIIIVFIVVTAIISISNFLKGQMVDFYVTLSIVAFCFFLYWYFKTYKHIIAVGSILFWMMALVSIFLVYEHHFNSTVVFLILSPLIAFLILPLRLALIYVAIFELMVAYLFYWGYGHYAEENKLIFSANGLLDYVFATLYLFIFWLFYHFTIENSIKKMQKLNQEKTILLQELHHRVKNNFNLMVSMVQMQYEHSDKLDTKEFIDSFKKRVESIVLAHELLYSQNISENVNLKEYIPKLTQHIKDGCQQDCKVSINYDIDSIDMSIDSLIYLGIIINELLINSLKYAFKDCIGKVNIAIKKLNSEYILQYSDNGSGLSDNPSRGFGSMVIDMALIQLKGTMELNNNKSGLSYKILFKG